MNYLVSYIREHDFTRTVCYRMVDYPLGLTWRQLQERFDPGYHYDNLRFYNLGSEILLNNKTVNTEVSREINWVL